MHTAKIHMHSFYNVTSESDAGTLQRRPYLLNYQSRHSYCRLSDIDSAKFQIQMLREKYIKCGQTDIRRFTIICIHCVLFNK